MNNGFFPSEKCFLSFQRSFPVSFVFKIKNMHFQERVVGINHITFAVNQDHKSNRRNIVLKSVQFDNMLREACFFLEDLANQTVQLKIWQFFLEKRNELTDIIEETVGFY